MTAAGVIIVVLVFLLPLAVLAAAVGVTIVVHRRLGKLAAVLLLAVIVMLPVMAWKRFAYLHAIGLVPAALQVTEIVFEETVLFGIGPGGNEEGLLLYTLPEPAAREIETAGLAYLNDMERRPMPVGTRIVESEWILTPAGGRGLPLETRLCDFSDCPILPLEVRQRVNGVLSRPGSFVAHARAGKTIIVSPAERLVIVRYGK